jgi:hypothetical protein
MAKGTLTFPKNSPVLKGMLSVGWRIVSENADGTVTIVFGQKD